MLTAATALAAVFLLAAPAMASAANTFVDGATGNDGNDCTDSSTPCQTIAAGIAQAGTNDTISVADGTYAESLTLGDGKSLVALDSTDPKPVIDDGSDPNPAITIDVSGAGSVDGFTIRSDFQSLLIAGTATVVNNTFDEGSVPSSNGSDVDVEDAPSVLVMNNEFSDPDATGAQTGITTSGATSPVISANTFSGLATGIEADSDGATISDNQITGAHLEGSAPGIGIHAIGGEPSISGNTIGPAGTSSVGVLLQDQQTNTSGTQLSRNEISGNDLGVLVFGATVPVTLSDDLIHDNTTGLEEVDSSGGGEARVLGATFDNGVDVSLQNSHLEMDSSILSTPVDLQDGTSSCFITHSRGDATPVADGCSDFDTNADPLFVDPSIGNYRLQAGSPLIDAGDPSPPDPGALDFYGNPRAVQGLPCDAVVRDIGAAEFQPSSPPQCGQDTFADAGIGNDSNDCLSQADPCQTIGAALAKMGPGHTTFVADGTYNESLTLDHDKSLQSLDETDPKPVIDGGMTTTITVASSGAGTVSGLRILSGYRSMDVNGTVTVDGNTFDQDPASDRPVLQVEDGSSVVITHNALVDPDASGFSVGVLLTTSGPPDPVVSDNTFDGLGIGVVTFGDARIDGNQFSGAHQIPASLPGAGVLVGGGRPTIDHNDFGPAADNTSYGVDVVKQGPAGDPVGAALHHNRISGYEVGVGAGDSDLAVTLDDDLIYGNGVGLVATDSSGDTPPSTQGDVSATNETIFDNTDADVRLDHTTLALDSSAVGSPIDLVGGNGACQISFSRGPTTTPGGSGCEDFQTSAAPQFVDPAAGDYHLQAGSALIDAGNPADPGPGATDFYGAPRAVLGAACDSLRRDIGAAEFQPGSPPECAQNTYADTSGGDNDNDCLSPADACRTVAAALARMAPSKTTFLTDGTYPESLTLDGGRSLVALDGSDPKPLIDAPPGDTAIDVSSSGAGEISGLNIRSDHLAIDAGGSVDINHNLFDSTSASSQEDVKVEGVPSVSISDNRFVDPDATGLLIGASVSGPDTVVADNTFTGLSAGIVALGGDPQISGNDFTGAHPVGSTPFGNLPGGGVFVMSAVATITQNTFGAPSAHPSAGVWIKPNPSVPAPTGASLSFNRISGNDAGVQVIDSDAPVTLSDDLIYANTTGVEATDSSADSPPSTQGDVSITNATIFDNAVDLQLSYTTATLDSAILGVPVDMVGGNGACQIAYSSGSAAPSANGCGNFDSTADPQFVDPGSGNYRLQAGSPLIDLGDPAAPAPGATDFYGDPRAVQGKACSTVRRDIGAAEYVPAGTPDCPAPPPTPAQPQPPADDPQPAAPKIAKHPDHRSDDTSPTFRFSSDVSGAGFRCRLDDGPYKRCVSPKTYRGLEIGKHIFRVYAVDPDGRKGKPRTFRFTVTQSG